MSRNLLDPEFGSLLDKRHVIVDRDTKYSAEFRSGRACCVDRCANTPNIIIWSGIIKASAIGRSSHSPFLNTPAELSIRGADSADS